MLTLLFAGAFALAAHSAQPADADAILTSLDDRAVTRLAACGVDAEVLGRLLSLSQQDFDQDFDGGWRPYGEREACWIATGELIEIYRDHAPGADPDGLNTLNWHAGQNFAYAGEQARAIALFEAAKSNDQSAWDLYADATIAFLLGDRDAAEAARQSLLAFAPDEAEQAARQRFLDDNPTITMPDGFVTDPPNLAVVDRLLDCWGGGYRAAYFGRCGDQPTAIDLTTSALGCAFIAGRFADFVVPGEAQGHRMAVDANWLTSPGDRNTLALGLRQEGRIDGPDAPFGMAFDADFAEAVAGLSEGDLDYAHAALTTPGAIACETLDASAGAFTDDITGVQRWAEAQMMDPDPGAPPAVETLSLSRPTVFDGGTRVLIAEAYTFTPIPISRPPSAMVAFTVYKNEGQTWVREASILLARAG